MDRIDSFNCMENLVEKYVFHITYTKSDMSLRQLRSMSLESVPFIYRETCSGCMQQAISELKARGFRIKHYYIEKVIVSDTTQKISK